jgi:hypothetical protein
LSGDASEGGVPSDAGSVDSVGRGRRLRRIAGDLLRVLIGLALGLVLAEVATRAWLEWLPQPQDGTYLRDRSIGYRLRPQPAHSDTAGNPYHVNALGFRDREHAPVKPPGTRRVLGIGDSFVAGEVPLAQNFLRVAERAWNAQVLRSGEGPSRGGSAPGQPPAASADSVEVVLMGLGGYGPRQYLSTLRSVGLATAPDLVLLCFYTGNDVTGVSTRNEVRRGELYSTSSSNQRLDILRRSHLFAWLEKRFFFGQRRQRIQERRATEVARARAELTTRAPNEAPEGKPAPAPLTRLYLEVIRNRLAFYAAKPSAPMERLWTEALGYLDEFDASCREAGVPWALVIIPDEFQVDPAVRGEALRRLGAQASDLDLDGPTRRLLRWASDARVPALDLLSLFRAEHARLGSLYLPSDTHWNEEGNRIAGEAIARFATALPAWRSNPAGVPAARAAGRTEGATP